LRLSSLNKPISDLIWSDQIPYSTTLINVHFQLHANYCHCPTFTSRYSFFLSTQVYCRCLLHLAKTRSERTLCPRRALCGRMESPPCENTLSTTADVAGTHSIFPRNLWSFENRLSSLNKGHGFSDILFITKTFLTTRDQVRDLQGNYSRPRPRPWPISLETKTETFEKWTRVTRPWSRDHNTEINTALAAPALFVCKAVHTTAPAAGTGISIVSGTQLN